VRVFFYAEILANAIVFVKIINNWINLKIMNQKTITIQTIVNAPIEKVWQAWNKPEEISKWAFASDDWEAIGIENAITPNKLIEYSLDDGRKVKIEFNQIPEGVKITETFEMENENTDELQRSGWQAILDNFKKHAESK
jgi:uncharacterized protein YndB with AHSA1/START domain